MQQPLSAIEWTSLGADELEREVESAGLDHRHEQIKRGSRSPPDLEFTTQVVAACRLPVIAEGRIHSPADAAAAKAAGAWAVCAGTAITITGWFAQAVNGSAVGDATADPRR